MKYLILIALIAFASAEWEYEGDVLVLGDDNFEIAQEHFKNLMFEFYAPWCGHCKTLAPIYSEAATLLRPQGIHLAKIDATVHKNLAQKHQIKGYPTVKFYAHGEVKDYRGQRTVEAIVEFAKSNSVKVEL
ncbi:hypothetical protein pb186bvf_001200 [Paramecium bursaria]